jgi:hypothetical protein
MMREWLRGFELEVIYGFVSEYLRWDVEVCSFSRDYYQFEMKFPM